MLVIKRDVKVEGIAGERDIHKALVEEVQVIQHRCYSSCRTPPRFSTAEKCVCPKVSLKMIQRDIRLASLMSLEVVQALSGQTNRKQFL